MSDVTSTRNGEDSIENPSMIACCSSSLLELWKVWICSELMPNSCWSDSAIQPSVLMRSEKITARTLDFGPTPISRKVSTKEVILAD